MGTLRIFFRLNDALQMVHHSIQHTMFICYFCQQKLNLYVKGSLPYI